MILVISFDDRGHYRCVLNRVVSESVPGWVKNNYKNHIMKRIYFAR